MEANVKFSIVTPSLNQCAYIEATIRSVIEQEGDFEIEYLVMDGGSADGSVNVIERYAELVAKSAFLLRCKGVRMYWTSEKDFGQSDAINRGLRRASGNFLAYINSDDTYMAGALARVASAFRQNPKASFVYGDGEVIDESGNVQWEWLSRPYEHRVMLGYHFLWNDFTNYIMQQATFWRSDVHTWIGLFDESLHYAMDVEYWIRAADKGLNLLHVPGKLAQFRMIQGTKSLSGPSVFWPDYLEIQRRYRGAQSLQTFLAYYYFNLARHNGWNLMSARAEANHCLSRWDSLAHAERQVIMRQAARAEGIASLLIANELQRSGDFEHAAEFIRRGCKQLPSVMIRPAGLYPLLKQLSGKRAASLLDRMSDNFVAYYRKKRFDYRYHQSVI